MQAIGQVRRYHRALWGTLLAFLIAGLLSIHLATAVSADVSVNIMNFKFDPTPLTIPVGTTVVWTNQDTAPHSATSDPGSTFTFDTGIMQKGQSGKITFSTPGTFTYFCTVHPNMHASVVVTAAGVAPAPAVAPAAPSVAAPSIAAPSVAAPPTGNPPAVTGPVGSGTGNSSGPGGNVGSSAPTTSTTGPSTGLPAYFVRRLGDG
ncbi:MAG: cupredoxin family copper-binding protein [Chloroflexota bacterium]|nr:cupredoxin family copper-binding protein [Chloroflexota bacterium]